MAVVTDLKPSAEYVINVAAENMIGIGLASNAVQINMAEEGNVIYLFSIGDTSDFETLKAVL